MNIVKVINYPAVLTADAVYLKELPGGKLEIAVCANDGSSLRVLTITDATIYTDAAIDAALTALVDNAPVEGDTLGKLYALIASGSGALTESDILDVLNSASTVNPLSANQGRVLQESIVALIDAVAQKTNAVQAAAAAPVQSVAGRGGDVIVTKTDVGLSNVDNTADMNKPVSEAQAAADLLTYQACQLDATEKANAAQAAAIAAGIPLSHLNSGGTEHALVTTSLAGFMSAADKVKLNDISGLNSGDETITTILDKLGIAVLSGDNTGDQTDITGNAGTATKLETARLIAGKSFDGSADIVIDKADVGLGNVSNTSDANKPVSTAQAAADSAVQIAAASDATTKANAAQAAAISTLRGAVATEANTLEKLHGMVTTLQTLVTSDDVNLDTIQEIVTYIKSEQSVIDTLGASKVNVSDVINVLTDVSTNKPLSAAQGKVLKDAIDALVISDNTKVTSAQAAAAAPVQSVAGKTGAVTLAKADVGLSNVDNTSDANKPVSTAQALADTAIQTAAAADATTKANAAAAASTPIAHAGSGGTAHAAATTAVNGFMSSSDKIKLDSIAAGAEVNAATNIGVSAPTASAVPLTSSTGTGSDIPAATASAAGVMTAADKTKLDGIAAGAQANVATNLSLGSVTGTTVPVASSTGSGVTLPAVTPGSAGVMTATDKTKLDAITGTNTGDQTNITGNAGTATKLQTSRLIAGKSFDGSADITLAKSDIGLGNIDNTSDANKPVSTAQAAADTAAIASALATVRGGVVTAGDTLSKLYTMITTIQTLMTSDDVSLDTIQEIVTYIKSEQTVINTLGTTKVNISDIINVLTDTSTNKPLSAAQGKALKDALDALTTTVGTKVTSAQAAAAAPVQSVAGRGGVVTLTKSDVGLSSVDNTSDANKPVSTAQATANATVQTNAASDATTKANAAQAAAIAASAPSSHVGVGGNAHAVATALMHGFMTNTDKAKLDGIGSNANVISVAGRAGVVTLTKADVGLSNVDNTADANKNVNSAAVLTGTAKTCGYCVDAAGIDHASALGPQVMNTNNGAAGVTFHRSGLFACNFGIDVDNILKVGGWSMGAVKYTIYHTGNLSKSTLGLGNVDNTSDATLLNNALLAVKVSPIVPVAALDVNCSAGNYFTKTINANSTLTFSNVPSGNAYGFTLKVTHTSGAITFPASVVWPGGTAPTLTTGKVHLFSFVTDDGGSIWHAVANPNYAS